MYKTNNVIVTFISNRFASSTRYSSLTHPYSEMKRAGYQVLSFGLFGNIIFVLLLSLRELNIFLIIFALLRVIHSHWRSI